jgi:hypothetical protein
MDKRFRHGNEHNDFLKNNTNKHCNKSGIAAHLKLNFLKYLQPVWPGPKVVCTPVPEVPIAVSVLLQVIPQYIQELGIVSCCKKCFATCNFMKVDLIVVASHTMQFHLSDRDLDSDTGKLNVKRD